MNTKTGDYTNQCVSCEVEFTDQTPCCCDDGCIDAPATESLLHRDGTCQNCCNHPISPRFEGKRQGGGILLRGE